MTKLIPLATAAVLLALPTTAAAYECGVMGKAREANISCAPGTSWDATAGECVAEATS
jgi:hypothetical protein